MENEVLRGEIYLADMRKGVHSEQNGIRPVLIIQNDIGNAQSPTVIIASITSKMDKPTLPTHVAIDTSCGLHMDSIVLMEQLRTIDKRRLGKYIGILDGKLMKAIDKAISASVSNDAVKRIPCVQRPYPQERPPRRCFPLVAPHKHDLQAEAQRRRYESRTGRHGTRAAKDGI